MPWYPKDFVPRRRYPQGQQAARILGLLRRPDASLKALMKATGWLGGGRQEGKAQARVREEREGGAPL